MKKTSKNATRALRNRIANKTTVGYWSEEATMFLLYDNAAETQDTAYVL